MIGGAAWRNKNRASHRPPMARSATASIQCIGTSALRNNGSISHNSSDQWAINTTAQSPASRLGSRLKERNSIANTGNANWKTSTAMASHRHDQYEQNGCTNRNERRDWHLPGARLLGE